MKKIIFRLNVLLVITGLIIALTFSFASIIDNKADDIISIVPITIFGCSFFIAGYIGIMINLSNSQKQE